MYKLWHGESYLVQWMESYLVSELIKMYSLIFTWIVRSTYQKWKISFANFNREKLRTKNLLLSLENKAFFNAGKSNFLIKLEQRLPKSFSQLHVKNSRFFLPYFLKKDDWPKPYANPGLPTLPYSETEHIIFWKRACITVHYIVITNWPCITVDNERNSDLWRFSRDVHYET